MVWWEESGLACGEVRWHVVWCGGMWCGAVACGVVWWEEGRVICGRVGGGWGDI